MLERRFIISVGSMLGLIAVIHCGEFLLNFLLTFLMSGSLMGTDIALPSLMTLVGTSLALIGAIGWLIYQLFYRTPESEPRELAASNS